LKNSRGFTVNNASEPFVENATATAIDAPLGFDEWDSGLTKEKCVCVHICEAIYALTTKGSDANKNLSRQGKRF